MRKSKWASVLRISIMCAIFSAMSIVLKELSINIGEAIRIGFENLPIIFAGIIAGPIAGVCVGLVADLVGALAIYGSVIPGVTVGACAIGAVSGLAHYLYKIKKFPLLPKIIIADASAHLIGSVGIKTVALSLTYGTSYFVLLGTRSLSYLIVTILEIALMYVLLRNRMIVGSIDALVGKAVKERRNVKMTYEQAIEYIHGVSWTFCKPGLERIEKLCELLGNPQEKLKFIHVAGTNGKGSFCSMLDSVLRSAGYKVGLFTSPYIVRFNERMRVNGVDIPDDTLAALTERVKPLADSMTDKPTEFELITAIAFEYFASEGCDVVVFEAGMGGRLDSTNVIAPPLLSVITGISLDHTAFLGDTVEKIAAEKAGIIKSPSPVLVGGMSREAHEVISNRARDLSVPLYTPDYDAIQNLDATLDGAEFDYKAFTRVKLKLLGLYQPRNAAMVLEAVSVLRDEGFVIPDAAVYSGLESARWCARFEIISRSPLTIFDGAHNPEGIAAAVTAIEHYFTDSKVVVLTGVLADKDYNFIAERLSRVASCAFTITPDNPRALTAGDYAATLASYGVSAVPTASIAEAVSLAVSCASERGEALVCLGSLYTYGDIIKEIKGE